MIGGKQVLDRRLSREEALIAHTRSNAPFLFQEGNLGSLAPGKYADLLVLDRDYLTVPVDETKTSSLYSRWSAERSSTTRISNELLKFQLGDSNRRRDEFSPIWASASAWRTGDAPHTVPHKQSDWGLVGSVWHQKVTLSRAATLYAR